MASSMVSGVNSSFMFGLSSVVSSSSSRPDFNGLRASASICDRNFDCADQLSSPASVEAIVMLSLRASSRPPGKDSGFFGFNHRTLNC